MPEPASAASPAETTHAALLARLNLTIDELLAPRVPRDRPVALLDFPETPNIGDSAIWLGATTLLDRHGVRPVYTCSTRSYSREVLSSRIGNGTILLSGGGNFGDLYPVHQALRNSIVRDFPNNPIVQLPQTIHFAATDTLDQSRRAFDAHPDVTLLVRDHSSLAIARASFRAPSLLCPDVSFALGPWARPAPRVPVVWLARSDKERREGAVPEAPKDVLKTDWLVDDRTWVTLLNRRLGLLVRRFPALRGLWAPLSLTYRPLARERMSRGARILGQGRVVITNRLHGHILSMLLGIPHVVLDNRYGKVRGFFDTWTHASPLVEWADDEGRALERAREMAAAVAN